MGDTQSRFGIISSLTKDKLDIITAKSQLDSEVKRSEQQVEEAKEALKDFEENIKSEQAAQRREYQRKIKAAEREAKNTKDRKASKEKAYDEKIKALNEALENLKEISKNASTTSA